MLNTWIEWVSVAAISSFALVKYVPEFSIFQSYILTAVSLLLSQYAIWFIYSVIIYPHYLSPIRHLPEPKADSYFNGSFKTIHKLPSGIPARNWINTIPNDGLIRYKFLFNKERVILTNPKSLAEVLTTKSYQFVKPDFVRFSLGRLLGEGLLSSEGDVHKAQRRNLMPAFSYRHIKDLYPIFWNKAFELNHKIEREIKETGDNTVEVGSWVSRAALDIITLAGMGRDLHTIEHPNNSLSVAYQTILSPTRQAQILGFLGLIIGGKFASFIPVKRNLDMLHARQVTRQTARDLIRHKKAQMAEKGSIDSKDIISVALESGHFSEEELVNQMMTFLLAGHETTSTSMQWAVYALARQPEIQTRLRAEIHSKLHPSGTLTAEGLDSLPYLHAVCQEVLRFHAPVPMTQRVCKEDNTIVGQFIPKNTLIIIAPWAINFSKELWGDDADEFNPERWLAPGQANTGGASSNYAFLTFIHGPRSCIGSGFARAEFMAMLAAWVGKWEFTLKDPDLIPEVKGGVTARPKDGMHVKITAVDWE